MSGKAKTWFISDLHIGHATVARRRAQYAGTLVSLGDPLAEAKASIGWRDETLAANWDDLIGRYDLVWVLGDISIGSSLAQREALEWIAARPGRKRLISGNHDGCHPMFRDSHKWLPRYLDVFESVQSAARIRVGGTNVLLSHFPYEADHSLTPRHMQWRLPDLGELLIHGHTHSTRRANEREMHVGVDAWNLKPVAMQTIQQWVVNENATAEARQ